MAKNEAIAKAIEADPYLKPRKNPSEADQQLYLKEVSFCCPLCGKSLRNRKQKKVNKLYEIAHIFPNSPTEEQYEQLGMNVSAYYPHIRDYFMELEGKNGFCMDVLSSQIKSCFIKMDVISKDKSDVFNRLVEWIMAKTLSTSRDACEAVVSFFVQNCEVFREITE